MLSTVRVILINKLLFSRHNEFLSFNNEGSETEKRTLGGGGGVRAHPPFKPPFKLIREAGIR